MNTSKVLTYSPSINSCGFLEYTERTVHVDHGKMYRITTTSGHSITVTDDHSLATVGKDSDALFSPLSPADSLNNLVPIPFGFEGACDIEATNKIIDRILSKDDIELNEQLLVVPGWLLRRVLTKSEYRLSSCKEIALISYLLCKASILHYIDNDIIRTNLKSAGYVPEFGKLVYRTTASISNPYRYLGLTWSEVSKVEEVDREPVTYDFTVPEFPLFIGNSILVYDTMQVHLPVTDAARDEAYERMMPSKNLFSVRNLEPTMVPQQESVFGLFHAAKGSSEKRISYSNPQLLREDIHSGKIRPDQPVKFEGIDTTAGIALVNEIIPKELRMYGGIWDKKAVTQLLAKVGKTKPELYTKVADEIKELGAWYSYLLGNSFGAKDFDLDDLKKSRNKSFKIIEDKMKEVDKSKDSAKDKYAKKVTLLREAQGVAAKLTSEATGNAFQQWAYSGARGSSSQVMQMLASPTVVSDPKDRVIPFLINKSYNEGLTPAEYWISSYGTRKGVVSAKLSVAPGGALAKELVSNVLDVVISCNDCGTKDGVEFPIGDTNDIIDRFEAGTNRHIDARYYEKLKAEHKLKVKVRSVITCKAKNGVCQMCFGHNEMGKLPEIGNNVGVASAQALSEPLTQMGLSAKHTAGSAAQESVGLTEISKFFQMPNQYAGGAVTSQTTGTVTKVTPAPAGGTNIMVGTKKYHISPGRKLIVGIGDKVSAGDLLTDGMPNVAQIVPHKGIAFGRQLLVNAAHDLYSRAGVKSIKRNFEVMARGLVNYVEVSDAGDFGDEFPLGDIVDYNEVQAEIAAHPEKKAPILKPVQRGTTYASHEKHDWMASFGTKYLQRNLIENAARNSKSDTHSYSPIPAYARAKEFGKGVAGRY